MFTTKGVIVGVSVIAAATVAAPTAAAQPLSARTAVDARTLNAPLDAAKTHKQKKKQKQKALRMKRKAVVRAAVSRAGRSSYVRGAEGPYAFDCSGLTLWAYRKVTGRQLPHNSAAQKQSKATRSVARANLKPGDLLFYGPGGSQHVALYIGKGRQVGANNPRVGVVVESINTSYWRARYAGAGRILR